MAFAAMNRPSEWTRRSWKLWSNWTTACRCPRACGWMHLSRPMGPKSNLSVRTGSGTREDCRETAEDQVALRFFRCYPQIPLIEAAWEHPRRHPELAKV